MSAQVHQDHLARLILSALENGGQQTAVNTFRWDISSGCPSPYEREIFARPEPRSQTVVSAELQKLMWPSKGPFKDIILEDRPVGGKGRRYITVDGRKNTVLRLDLLTPCRRCDHCRSRRRNLWVMRAKAEIDFAPRTWFGTFTLRPDEQFRTLTIARQKLARQGIDFDTLDFGDQFREHAAVAFREVTTYLKRVRKHYGPKSLRYLWVCEAHKTGLPHFHALLHETDTDRPLRHDVLTSQWKLGFSQLRLASDKSPSFYVAKYLAKDLATRVRASQGYGHGLVMSEPEGGTYEDALKRSPMQSGVHPDPRNNPNFVRA